jgi:hypothetical protein
MSTEKQKVNSCPEFPYFGAKYPDARCIDGYLWDLDKCDEKGLYSTGDNPPCPFCNQENFLKQHEHDDGFDREKMIEFINNLKIKHSIK